MDISQHISPLDVIRTISLSNCLIFLSDFLYLDNKITDDDQFKRIPVVNGIYEYLDSQRHSDSSKMLLVRTLLQGSDFYGEEADENLDPSYVNAILNLIVESFVFNRFINVQGFLVDVMRRTKAYETENLIFMAQETLSNLAFENEFGAESYLSGSSVEHIVKTFIEPQFFIYNGHHNIFSIDYIYAQAGLTFLRSNSLKESNKFIFNENKYDASNVTDMHILFHQCIGAALAIEQAVLSGELNETSLQIFSLSALSYYVYKTSRYIQHFNWINVQDIITSPDTWVDIYDALFDFINDELNKIRKAQEDDYKFQFFSSLANYKNFTSLARDIIETMCADVTEKSLQDKITEYINQPNGCFCHNNNQTFMQLPDLNKRFTDQNTEIKEKCYNYEKFSLYETFDDSFKQFINSSNIFITIEIPETGVEVSEGKNQNNLRNYKSEPDYLRFEYLNNSFEYYLLNRTDFRLKLCNESTNPELFKPVREHSAVVVIVKNKDESFETFVHNFANRKATYLFEKLAVVIINEKEEPNYAWLIDILLQFIPFYSCIQEIIDPNITIPFSCLFDILFSIPGAFTLLKVGYKVLTLTTRLALYAGGITLRTVLLKLSFKATVRTIARSVAREFSLISQVYTKQLLKKTGIELLRLVDPGFELTYIMGRQAINIIQRFIKRLQKKGRYSFEIFFKLLEESKKKLHVLHKKINSYIGDYQEYVNVFFERDSFKFGFKFIYRYHQVGVIRLIPGATVKLPVFKEGNYYRAFDVTTKKFLEPKFSLDGNTLRILTTDSFTPKKLLDTNYEHQKSILRKERNPSSAVAAVKDEKLLNELKGELRKYIFPDGDHEKRFVDAWLQKDWDTINYLSGKYKTAKPDIFYDLKYGLRMDNERIIKSTLENRISSIYSSFLLRTLEYKLKLDALIEAYEQFNLQFLLKFEDLVAIGSYVSVGFETTSLSTDWMRRMKYALYRLAIRQCDDPTDDFISTVYSWEIRNSTYINSFFTKINEIYELPRFTLASEEVPENSIFLQNRPITKVLYRMTFNRKYLRAVITNFHFNDNYDEVLLPGTKFNITNVQTTISVAYGPYVIVDLNGDYSDEELVQWQRDVMKEIKILLDANTTYYINEAGK